MIITLFKYLLVFFCPLVHFIMLMVRELKTSICQQAWGGEGGGGLLFSL